MRDTSARPFLYLGAGLALQGLSPVLTKALLSEAPPAAIVSARYLIAVLFLLPFGWRHTSPQELQAPRRRDWIALFLVGALGSGVAALLFTQALLWTDAGLATALSKTAPILVAGLGYLLLQRRSLAERGLFVAMLVAGDLLLAAGECQSGAAWRQRLLGDSVAFSAGLLRAGAEILGRASLRRFYPSSVALWRFGIGFIVCGAWAIARGDYQALGLLQERSWLLLFALGAVCTSLSMSLYYRGLRTIPAHLSASLRLLSALLTVGAAWLALGEALSGLHLTGLAVLLAGAYLFIVRTTRRMPAAPAVEAPRPAAPLVFTQTLKGRLALLVASLITLTVATATGLSLQHSQALLEEQIRLTMVKTATMILQLRGVALPPSPETYRQYLDRLIHHRFVGRFYSVDLVYAIVLDSQGNIIAFARSNKLIIRDRRGRPLRGDSPAVALRLLELLASGELQRQSDIIPVAAELQQGGSVRGLVRAGFRRSVAQRVIWEIVLRNLSLALLLILLGGALAYRLTDWLARPLEELAATVRRMAQGELALPLRPAGSRELESLSRSVERMAEALRQAQLLREAWGRLINPSDEAQAPSAVTCFVRFQPAAAEESAGLGVSLLDALLQNEGTVLALGPGYVVAGFGGPEAEQDDVLRAIVAAWEWQAGWASPSPPLAVVLIDYAAEAPEMHRPLAERLAAWQAALNGVTTKPEGFLYLTAAATEIAAPHVELIPTESPELFRVVRLREEAAWDEESEWL